MEDREYNLAKKLLEAVMDGPVYNIGGISDCHGNYLMNQTDMYLAVRTLDKVGISVRRVDAGGSPTWRLSLDFLQKCDKLVPVMKNAITENLTDAKAGLVTTYPPLRYGMVASWLR